MDEGDPWMGSTAQWQRSRQALFLGPTPPDAHMGNARASRPGDEKHRLSTTNEKQTAPSGRRSNYCTTPSPDHSNNGSRDARITQSPDHERRRNSNAGRGS